MDLKVFHITKKRLDRKKADVSELWENVLKPKWEKRCRARAERLVTKLTINGSILVSEFTTQQEVRKSVEKIEIVIEVGGNNLSIKCATISGDKNQ
jgi:hypothetical protein